MEKIIIKNFGPIKDVELEIKDINVFIGSTSSGKSTVAKLIAISRELEFVSKSSFDRFIEFTQQYNIDFKITNKTYIRYSDKNFYWELRNKKIENNGENWLLTRLVVGFLEAVKDMSSLLGRAKHGENFEDSNFNKFGRQLLGPFILGSINETIKIEYEESGGKIPEQAKQLLDIVESYKARLDNDNLSSKKNIDVLRELMNDRRFSKLLPLLDVMIGLQKILYIPAERILLSMVAESLFGLMNNNVAIAQCIKGFGAQFESARKKIERLSIPFLSINYSYSDKSNFVIFDDGAKVKLEQASSGLQSIIPLLLVVEANVNEKGFVKNYFVIEEPELNLYPTVQKNLVEFIIERINKHEDKLIVTTHSPYVLTSLDNMIQASNAAKANPEQKEKVSEIVPEEKWVNFDRVACYYFEDGTCRSTLDTENQTIGASNIDDVSEELGKTFDELLELKYAHVS